MSKSKGITIGLQEANDIDETHLYPSTPDEINTLRSMWESAQNNDKLRLSYANSLYRSKNKNDVKESLIHFQYLQQKNLYYNDCLLGLTLAHYNLEEYELSRSYIEELYRTDNNSSHYKSLHQGVTYRLEKQKQNEQKETFLMSAATIGVATLAIGTALTLIFSKKK